MKAKTMPQKIKAFVVQTPQKFYQRKLSILPLVLVAIVAGTIGTYALINSLAATPCTLDLDHLTVSSGCPVTKSDTAASGNLATVQSLWGNLQCADASRLKFFTSGGDPHNTANGTAQGNTSYYEPTVLNGDDFYGSRCELGQNERRYGENGGAGTFQLYQQGEHKITFVSIRLPSNFQSNVNAWQTIMQMKQTEPDNTDYSSPILEMQEYGNEFRVNSDPAGTLWSTSAVTGQWVRFAFDVTYSQNNNDGKIRVYVDKNGDGDTLDPGEQSPVITTATLGTQTQTSIGPGTNLHAGDPVPGHLRLGLYHNPSYDCPAPTGCSTDDDNVQIVDLTGLSTTTGPISPPPPADTTAPAVSLTAPPSATTVSGSSTTVSANASDDTGVAGVQFKLDGNNLGSEDTTAPYTTNWDTTTATNGSHTLTAVARDAAGNTKTSNSVSVTVNNSTTVAGCTDVLSPGGSLQTFLNSLQAGDTGCVHSGTYGAKGTIANFASTGTSSRPVVLKKYPGDANPLITGQFRVTGAYQTVSGFIFDGPTGLINGSEDVPVWLNGSNNTIFSENGVRNSLWHAGIFVSGVTNAKILRNYVHDNGDFSDPAQANLDHGIYWASGSGVIANNIVEHNYAYGIQLYPSPDNVLVENNTINNQTGRGGIIIGETAANTVIANNIISNNLYGINVYSLTGTNNIASSNLFWNNSGGNVTGGCGLAITNSISGNPLFLSANNYHLTSSSPAIDQANSSYAASPDYDGTARPQGSSSDIGAYEFTGAPTPPVDTTDPSVSFASPANNATVSGIVTATANASDNVGVSKVELSLDGTLKMTDTTAPYNYSFDSKTLTNGNHTLTAKAYDAAGNSSSSTTITIHVNNPDITPPNAPTGLSATATNPTTVHLSWNAAADTGANQTGVVKYNVLRNGVVIAQPTTTSYTDATATAKTNYSYTVQAVDGAGNVSDDSGTATVTTPAAPDTAAPSMPANLAATAISASQVNVTWNASTDSGGSGLTGYNIYRDGTKLNSSPVTGTSYGDSTVNATTTYSYRVEAVDGAGNKSAQTSAVSVTTPRTPDVIDPSTPANLTAKAISTSQVNLAWDASTDSGGSGLAGYNVYRDGTKLNSSPVTSRSYSDTSVDANTRYSYQIEAVDGAGNTSVKSSAVRVSTPRPPRTEHGGGGGTSTGGGSSQSSGSGSTSGSGAQSGGSSNPTPPTPGHQRHAIAVRIFGAGHQPARGASVAFSNQTATTDGNGVAHFNSVAPGKQTVSVGYNGKETSKVINVKDVATQSEPELFNVATVRNVNPALLAIPVIVLLAAGGFFMRPWEKFARSPIDNSVADSVITSNHPAEVSPQPGRKLETPGTVYSPKESKKE